MTKALRYRILWSVIGTGATIAAAAVARRGLHGGWEAVTDEKPPLNPVSPDVSWKEAVAWSIAGGVVAGLARVVARRGAAAGWLRATGELPPV